MGASLKPDYFYEKVRLFVALAPIVRMDHIKSSLLKDVANISAVLPPVIYLTGAYDLAPFNYERSKSITAFCTHFLHLCEKIQQGIYDWNRTINNPDRYDDY